MWFRRLYLLNVVLLITHEIDSAYWQEWLSFGLPGAQAGFLAAHLPLVALLTWGYQQVHDETRLGLWISLAVCFIGLFVIGSTGTLLAAGRGEFRSPASIAVLAAIAMACGVQIPMTIRRLKPDLALKYAPDPAAPGQPDPLMDEPFASDPLIDDPINGYQTGAYPPPTAPPGSRRRSGRHGHGREG